MPSAEILLLRRLRARHVPYVITRRRTSTNGIHRRSAGSSAGHCPGAAGAYTCNSEAGRILRRKGLRGEHIVLALGVDVHRFGPVDRPPPRGSLRVGFVGRLIPHKGVAVLLDAVASDPRMLVEIFGAGSELGTLTPRSNGWASPTGSVSTATSTGRTPSDLPPVDVLAVPSLPMPGWIEQFGRVVVEAQASGVPVVASASGALPDVVGHAGLLVPPDDPAALGGRSPGSSTSPDCGNGCGPPAWPMPPATRGSRWPNPAGPVPRRRDRRPAGPAVGATGLMAPRRPGLSPVPAGARSVRSR